MRESLRILGPDDGPALARFFSRHPYTTLFLQSNLLEAGLVDEGRRHHGTWAAAFAGDEIEAVATHFWNGNLIVECPRRLEETARLAVERSKRAVRGILGPHAQGVATRRALGMVERVASLDAHEDLFALPLARLRVPPALAEGRVRCRAPREEELPLLTQWRVEYSIEILGARENPELRASSGGDIKSLQRLERQWLLEWEGRPVAYSAFNAQTPDCVQVGGVYTPPALRARGYARAVVAGTLLAARAQGVRDAVLFTGRANRPAQAVYRSLGFEPIGDWGLTLF
jgi:GNAT superfamily N-acetyltransferase